MQSSETKVSKEAAKVGAAVATTSGALGFAQSSFASTTQPEEVVSNLAGIDGRIAIFFVFAPVLGWVAYNILGPGLKQLDDMQVKNAKRKGIVGGAIGSALGASLTMQRKARTPRNKSSGTWRVLTVESPSSSCSRRSSVGSRITSWARV